MVDFKALVSGAPAEKKNSLISAKKGLIESIHIIDEKGTEMKIIYDFIDSCMICNNKRLFNSSSCGCPVCDGIMTLEKYNESQKGDEMEFTLEPEPTVQANVDPKMKSIELIKIIMSETGMTNKSLTELINEKKEELKGLISEAGALYLIAREQGIPDKHDVPDKDVVILKPEPVIELKPEAPRLKTDLIPDIPIEPLEKTEAKFEMVELEVEPTVKPEIIKAEVVKKEEPTNALAISKPEQQLPNIQNITSIPSIQEVDVFLAMYNHVKKSIVDKSDFHTYKVGRPPRMKKSGWRKFIKPFNLTVELIREENLGKENPRLFEFGMGPDGKPDVHAEVWVRVSVTHVSCKECGFEVQGQLIEALGYKSKSEYWSTKYRNFGSYDLHNLISTARTRGQNIGISDLVGFGEVSAEEFKGGIK